MRSLAAVFFLSLAALLTPACSGGAADTGTTDTTASLCCGGKCGAPEGYCCNPDTLCAGSCPEGSKGWDKDKGAPMEADAAPAADGEAPAEH